MMVGALLAPELTTSTGGKPLESSNSKKKMVKKVTLCISSPSLRNRGSGEKL